MSPELLENPQSASHYFHLKISEKEMRMKVK